MGEPENVVERYEKRKTLGWGDKYSPLLPSVYMLTQERERALIRWIKASGLSPLNEKRVLEIGCGSGGNLLEFLRLGFRPENLIGNELLEDRASEARHFLPAATRILCGDASEIDFGKQSFDVVLQFTVFTSLLDKAFQQKLADRMWSLVKPGGGILWYDFVLNNPGNPDVRGIPYSHIRTLFPRGRARCWRLTLAPPLSRLVTRVHPSLYNLFNYLPLLRTHLLCWIEKTDE